MGKRVGNPPPPAEGLPSSSSKRLPSPFSSNPSPPSLAKGAAEGPLAPIALTGGGGVRARRGRKPSLPLRAGEGMDCFHFPSTAIAATGILRGYAKPFVLDASATLYSPSLLALHSSAAHFAVGDANLLLDVSPRSLRESFPAGTRLLIAYPCPASLTEYVRSTPPSLLFYRRRGGPPFFVMSNLAGNIALPLELRWRLSSFSWSHPPPPPRSPPLLFSLSLSLRQRSPRLCYRPQSSPRTFHHSCH